MKASIAIIVLALVFSVAATVLCLYVGIATNKPLQIVLGGCNAILALFNTANLISVIRRNK